jgi:hypothetical protein
MVSTCSTCGIEIDWLNNHWLTWCSCSNLLSRWSHSIFELVGTKWVLVCDAWFWKPIDVVIDVDALVLGRLSPRVADCMVVEQIWFHQTVKQVHDCHHYEHSPPSVGLLFMVFLDEWLRALFGFPPQPILLHFDVVNWFLPFVLHLCLVHSKFISHRLHLPFILFLCIFLNKLMYNLF